MGVRTYSAGDTAQIAEASAAIFSGRIVGRQIAQDFGIQVQVPQHWPELAAILRSKPGKTVPFVAKDRDAPVFPVIRCVQEIPCNPCQQACPEGLISMPDSIMSLPEFAGNCLGCGKCVTVCPGLAINLVFNDYDPTGNTALLMLPFEFNLDQLPLGKSVDTVDIDGNPVGKGVVVAVRSRQEQNRRHLVLVQVPAQDKLRVAGFSMRQPSVPVADVQLKRSKDDDDPIVCRCERVRRSAIVKEIREGVRDINQLKALSRSGMGGCGGKTCADLLMRIMRQEGVDMRVVTPGTVRPLVAEMPLGAFVTATEGVKHE